MSSLPLSSSCLKRYQVQASGKTSKTTPSNYPDSKYARMEMSLKEYTCTAADPANGSVSNRTGNHHDTGDEWADPQQLGRWGALIDDVTITSSQAQWYGHCGVTWKEKSASFRVCAVFRRQVRGGFTRALHAETWEGARCSRPLSSAAHNMQTPYMRGEGGQI